MSTFQIRVTNRDFSASDDHELTSLEAAGRQGVKAALEIGADEVNGGKPFFGAEVSIVEDGSIVSRFVVSVGASPLM